MLNILRYLKRHGGMVVLILALLCVQAYCDLTLPRYTSDIVDVGIQQSGVERVTPNQMRESTLEALTLFLSDQDEAVFRSAYTADENGVYTLTVKDGDTLDRLDGMLGLPMVALYQMEQQGMDPAALVGQAEQMGREVFKAQLMERMTAMADQYGATAGTMTDQMAILFVQQEYHLHHADRHGLSDDLGGVHHAAPGGGVRQAHPGGAGYQGDHPRPGARQEPGREQERVAGRSVL